MKKEKIYKVYMHEHLISKKKYFGITSKKNPNNRWSNGQGYKRCPKFWNAIQKYGWNNFKHIVLFDRLTKEEASEIEIELICYFNTTDINFGYNIANGGFNGNVGLKRSDDFKRLMSKYAKERIGEKANHYNKKHSIKTKLLISKTSLGRKHTIVDKIKMSNNCTTKRKIICIETGEKFNSIIEASRSMNLYQNHISAVC